LAVSASVDLACAAPRLACTAPWLACTAPRLDCVESSTGQPSAMFGHVWVEA
jgi:hypothetical protein